MDVNFNKVEFIRSAVSPRDFLRDGLPQLAFAGRSNVGKSSVINRLVNRKNFARVGASPGKTSQINYFASGLISLGVMIVDARHKPTADDVTMASWFRDTGCPLVVAANKLDKLKKSEIDPNLALIRQTLSLGEGDLLLPFSAEKGVGREDLIGALCASL